VELWEVSLQIFLSSSRLSAWVLVASFIRISVASFKGDVLSFKNVRFVWATLLLVDVAALLSLYLPTTRIFQGQIYPGGLLGLGVAQAMTKAFAFTGVQIILWSLMAVLIVFYSEKLFKN